MISDLLLSNPKVTWLVLKLFLLVGLLIYAIFCFVIDKQVGLMTDTLEIGFEKPIKVISKIHFLVAVFVFLIAIFVL